MYCWVVVDFLKVSFGSEFDEVDVAVEVFGNEWESV